MKHIKFATVAIGALAAPMLALGIGSGTASALPGISIDPGTNGEGTIGIGDQSPTGAVARAKPGNTAVAVSIFGSSNADASEGGSTKFGEGNNVVTFGSSAKTGPNSAGNNVLATGGIRDVTVNGTHDNVVNLGGGTTTDESSNGNTIINVGGYVVSQEQGKAPGVVNVSVCGTTVSGQADHITPSRVVC